MDLHLEDIWIQGAPAPEDVRNAMVCAMGVDNQDVRVLQRFESLKPGGEAVQLQYATKVPGEFPSRVEVVLCNDVLRERLDRLSVINAFASALGLTCLVSDDTLNPFRWLLVKPDAGYKPVFIEFVGSDQSGFRVTGEA